MGLISTFMDMLPAGLPEATAKLALAALLSGMLGLERQRRGRAAGLRTHILVCLGSTLLMIVSVLLAEEWKVAGGPVWLDKGRIAAGIITGIGFLGAGTIINVQGENRGLTTAAMIWFVAALGIVIGAGYYAEAVCATGFALVVVLGLGYLEGYLPSSDRTVLTVRSLKGLEALGDVEKAIREKGFALEASRVRITGSTGQVDMTFELESLGRARIEELIRVLHERLPDAERITFER